MRVAAEDAVAVVLPDGREVQLVLTADDLSMLGGAWGSLDQIVAYVAESLEQMPADHGFLVYSQYDVEPSRTRELVEPPDDDVPPGPGEWVTRDGDGRVVSRYSEWLEAEGDEPT